MNNNILFLIVAGIALSVLHIPSVVITLSVIGGLSFFTIKIFWRAMQMFSSSAKSEPVPVRSA